MPAKWYIYIIRCEDQSYYIGRIWAADKEWTKNLFKLGVKYIKQHKPEKLVYLEGYEDVVEARLREKHLRRWVEMRKEKFINGEWRK